MSVDLEKVLGPLKLELRRGCKNDAVIGGVDNFILSILEGLDGSIKKTLKDLFTEYSKKDDFERKRIVQEAIRIILDASKEKQVKHNELKEDSQKSHSIKLSELFKPVQYVKGIGPELSKRFKKIGIETAYDLLFYFPKGYLDLRNVKKIYNLSTGETALLKVRIKSIDERKGKINILTVLATDGTGYITAVWFNQSYLKKMLSEGMEIYLYGKVQFAYGKWEMPSPEFEIPLEGKELVNALRITPIYSLTEGLSQKILRSRIKNFLDELKEGIFDYIDYQVLSKYGFLSLDSAIKNIHFPADFSSLSKAKERLAFNELFELQYLLASRKKNFEKAKGIIFKVEENEVENFERLLPFELTADQKKVMKEILSDFTSGHPMNRLLHGDVGSGKTVVAFFASFIAYKNGFQTALMSPTEILAEQTYKNALNLFKDYPIKIALLTSSTKKKEKENILKDLLEGSIDLIIGTHALIEENVQFKNLGLVIVDEQHRFGVLQRSALREKAVQPHTLVMSATPIPRTLALTLYGDLDVSEIKTMPKGRKSIITKVFLNDEISCYSLVKEELDKGHKAYVVCPLIEDSEALEVQSVETLYEKLKKTHLKGYKIAKLHGQMNSSEKQKIMEDFKNGETQVIVSTTVVEVGVDVKDATVIVVEDADRFGLATLHQLRGRVGRSDLQSYCLLLTRNPSKDGVERLRILEKTNNGFEVAEEDLKLRGPGEILGTRQSGISSFQLHSLLQESSMKLLEIARTEAFALIEKRTIWDKEKVEELNKIILQKFKGVNSLIEVG